MRQHRLRAAGILAALADVVAVFVVEAGTPAPLALLLRFWSVAAFDVAMVVPVARRADDRKSDEPNGDAGEDAAAMTRLGLLNRDGDEACRQNGDQARAQDTLDHGRRLAPKLGELLARRLNSPAASLPPGHFLQGNASWNARKTVDRAGSCIFSGLRSAQST